MFEPEESAADNKVPDDGHKSSENDQKSTDDANLPENLPVAAESDKTSVETDMVTEQISAAASTETEVVAKQPATTDMVAMALPAVDEKGEVRQSATETGAGDATVQTAIRRKAQCMPLTTTEDTEAEESEKMYPFSTLNVHFSNGFRCSVCQFFEQSLTGEKKCEVPSALSRCSCIAQVYVWM